MSLYLRESGPSNAPTILFLHGGGGGSWMWQPQIEQLTDFHCLAPDLPEHGHSQEIKPFSIQNATLQIAELIRSRAHGGKTHLVGLSLGAQLTVALLAQFPELAHSAVISSALVRPIPGAGMLTPGLIGFSYRWSVPPFKKNDWWIRLNMKYAAGVPKAYYAQFKQDFQNLTESGFTHFMLENQLFRMPPGLERVQTPTLIVVGRQEYAAMKQSARDLAAAIPGACAYVVAHEHLSMAAEHNWNLNAPQLFSQMLRAWFNRQPLPPALKSL